jgi:peptidoglycan/LPS O-acetylase OafA/YrhL
VAANRIVGLDGLRALSIALVLADHAAGNRFQGGGVGVAVFFVLSGYLITSLLAAEYAQNNRIQLRLFYGRRALRLWPALLAMLVVTVALGASKMHALVAGLYFTDITDVFNRGASPYGHTWSLGVEEQFYLFWPLALAYLVGRTRRTLAIALSAGIAFSILGCAVWTWQSIETTGAIGVGVYNPIWQGHGLLIGCLLALLGREIRIPRAQATAMVAGAGIVLVALIGSWTADKHVAVAWNVTTELLAAILIVALRDVTSGVYTWPPAVWMGQRSYAIYLWHLPLMILLAERGVPHFAAVGIVLAFAAAEVSARLVEKPFLKLKGRLYPESRRRVTTADDVAPAVGFSVTERLRPES